jgi:hypothetical protein
MNKELEANTNLSHYRIVSKIGEGGTGEPRLLRCQFRIFHDDPLLKSLVWRLNLPE